MKTAWNTDYYTPPSDSSAGKKYYEVGELPAHVYAAVLAGAETVAELCKLMQRSDQRIYAALAVLEDAGYVTRTEALIGKGHKSLWKENLK